MMIIVNERVVLLGTFRCGLLCRLGSDKRRCRSNVRDPACQISVWTWVHVNSCFWALLLLLLANLDRGRRNSSDQGILADASGFCYFENLRSLTLYWDNSNIQFLIHTVPVTYLHLALRSVDHYLRKGGLTGMVQANQASHPTSRGLPWTLHETFTTDTGDYPARIPLDSNVHDSSWFIMILSRIEQYTVYTGLYSIQDVDSLWFPGGFAFHSPRSPQGIAMSPSAAGSPGAPRPSVSHWAASWQHGFRLGTRKLAPVGYNYIINILYDILYDIYYIIIIHIKYNYQY